MNELKKDNKENEKSESKPWLKYFIAFGVGLVMMVLLFWKFGLFSGEKLYDFEIYRIVADSCFVPGILIFSSGALVWVSRNGAFDALGYSIKYFFNIRFRRDNELTKETFYEYKERRSKEPKTPCLYLVLTGLFFMAVAAVFVVLFNKAI